MSAKKPADEARSAPLPASREAMVELLDRCMDYRTLRGRRDDLALPLRGDEQERLASLERRFADEAELQELGPLGPLGRDRLDARYPVELAVELHEPGQPRSAGTILNLSAGGLYVETRRSVRRGARVMFRFLDESSARAWCFAAEVVWSGDGGMGLRFSGVPLLLHRGRLLIPAPDAAARAVAA